MVAPGVAHDSFTQKLPERSLPLVSENVTALTVSIRRSTLTLSRTSLPAGSTARNLIHCVPTTSGTFRWKPEASESTRLSWIQAWEILSLSRAVQPTSSEETANSTLLSWVPARREAVGFSSSLARATDTNPEVGTPRLFLASKVMVWGWPLGGRSTDNSHTESFTAVAGDPLILTLGASIPDMSVSTTCTRNLAWENGTTVPVLFSGLFQERLGGNWPGMGSRDTSRTESVVFPRWSQAFTWMRVSSPGLDRSTTVFHCPPEVSGVLPPIRTESTPEGSRAPTFTSTVLTS